MPLRKRRDAEAGQDSCNAVEVAGDRLRVLMVTPRYLPYLGGVERYVHEVATRLPARGIDTSVLTTDPTGNLPQHETSEGIEITRVRAWPRESDYHFAPDVFRTIARGGDWDIVHVQSYHTFVAPMAMIAAWRRNVPYCVTFHAGGHSSRLRRLARRPQWAMLAPLLRHAARLIAIAPFEIDLYSRRLNIPVNRFTLIPAATDFGPDTPLPANDAIRSIIASVGRLERYKGHHRLIEALPHILRERPDISVWIAGAGPYEPKLRRLGEELGVADRVEIRAVRERGVMARELSTVSLVVLLSEHETQPLAALEAVALGRPTLVLDVPGSRDLVERGLAKGLPSDASPAEVADGVLEQLRNPFVPGRVELPSWDDCVQHHVEMYRGLANVSQYHSRR
jgi:glycosyltransferase involved in cell wall biosynthesis